MAEVLPDSMPDYGKLPSISVLDMDTLPDFDDEAPTATNLVKKKKKNNAKRVSKKGGDKTPVTPQKKTKLASNVSNTSNVSNASSTSNRSRKSSKSNKSRSSSKTKRSSSVAKTPKSSKKKKKTQPRKASVIRDRVKKYDEMTRKAKEEQKDFKVKKPKKKDKTPTPKKDTKKDDTKATNKKDKKKDDDKSNKSKKQSTKSDAKNEKKPKENAKPSIPKKKSDSLSPVTSTTDEAGDDTNLAPSLLIQESTDSQKMMNQTRMLESISPMNKDMQSASAFTASAFSTDTVKINVDIDIEQNDGNESEDSNDPLYVITPVPDDNDAEEAKSHTTLTISKSAVDELKNGPPKSKGLESPPPQAYQMKSLSLPSDPGDINADRSFEAMYEPAYRHAAVPFPKKNMLQRNDTPTTPTTPKDIVPTTPKDNTVDTVDTPTSPTADSKEIEESQEEPQLLKGVRDGDTDRNEIKQKILEKEEYKRKLKRKQSRTTTFDAKKTTKMNLWGRKMNEFPTKNGKQKIVEWRFISSDDNNSHTLVLQHEQIKKKKKSKRMLILDGDEKYSDKSKKTEWKLKIPNCSDVLEVNIENIDVNAMKYKYFLKINGMAYSAVFHKWSSQQQH